MRLGYCLVFLFLILPTAPQARALLAFSADANVQVCEVADPGPGGLVTIHVLLMSYTVDGVTGVRFSAPVPPMAGLTHVSDISPYVKIGSSQSDVAVAFGTCEVGTFLVMSLLFVRTSEGDLCTPYQAQYGAIYTDCSFAEQPLTIDGVALNSNGQCNPRPIHDITPTDGAVDQPLIVSLAWKDGYYVCREPAAASLADDSAELYFGTAPRPPFLAVVTPPYSIGPLAPETKYYWRVYTQGSFLGTPVMSFTTTNKVATQQSTWGAIKALYR